MRFFPEDLKNEEQIEKLMLQRRILRRIMTLLKQIREERRACTYFAISALPTDTALETYQVYVYQTGTNQVLARGINDYEAAKHKANQLRKSLNPKWDQGKFKAVRSGDGSKQSPLNRSKSHLLNPAVQRRIDCAHRHNPSKGRRFRRYCDSAGNYHDID